MEATKDPDQLSVEMRKHFQMTEDIMALMLERKKLMAAHAPASGAQPSAPPASPSQPGMGGRPGPGMPGGMMQKEKEMGGMHGGAMPGMGGSATPPTTPGSSPTQAPSRDMDEMMRRIAEHSAALEKIQDRTMLAQEMLRHQKMLDQMLQLLQ